MPSGRSGARVALSRESGPTAVMLAESHVLTLYVPFGGFTNLMSSKRHVYEYSTFDLRRALHSMSRYIGALAVTAASVVLTYTDAENSNVKLSAHCAAHIAHKRSAHRMAQMCKRLI